MSESAFDSREMLAAVHKGCRQVAEQVAELRGARGLTPFQSSKVSPTVTGNLAVDINVLRLTFENASDLTIRHLSVEAAPARRAAVVYLEGMVNRTEVTETVLEPLILRGAYQTGQSGEESGQGDTKNVTHALPVTAEDFWSVEAFEQLVIELLEGNTVLLVDGQKTAWVGRTLDPPSRNVDRAHVESSIIGPQDSFTESIRTNLGLLRKRLKCPQLAVESITTGRRSKTEIRLLFITDIASRSLVDEVRRRLKAIDRDMILATGHLKDLIIENPYSIFPMIEESERPDTVAASLSEGRVAVMVDNDPFVLLVPSSFYYAFEAVEDHYTRFYLGSAFRLLRLAAFFLATFLIPVYVAVVDYHPQLIPLPLLLNIASSGLGTPFPTAVSAFLIEFILEVFREAGIRLPERVGRAVGIVGAIVLGQAAVQVGFVPPALLIVSAAGAIVSFAVPGYELELSMRLLRFPMLILATVLGFFGVGFGAVVLFFHVASLKSFGVPFLSFAELLVKAPPQSQSKSRPYAGADRTRHPTELSMQESDSI
jgi:hypothetical protein